MPVPSSRAVSQRMSAARRRDTAPEMLVRREAHRRGLRYRVDAPLPGMPRRRADMLFPGARVAVFIDGCFWHACPDHRTSPKANGTWWAAKLAKNVVRDRDTDRHLEELGWVVLRFWEHENHVVVVDRVETAVRRGRTRIVPPVSGAEHRSRSRDAFDADGGHSPSE
ncbi:DNA mismatch endonuclease Vsr [Actinomycetospora corticicola]|uniref:DNA mismatch endonuclease Vsr n=2 Tax=Actinomycetospora corticicola TaxID=663602 RepID=UPI0015C84BE4